MAVCDCCKWLGVASYVYVNPSALPCERAARTCSVHVGAAFVPLLSVVAPTSRARLTLVTPRASSVMDSSPVHHSAVQARQVPTQAPSCRCPCWCRWRRPCATPGPWAKSSPTRPGGALYVVRPVRWMRWPPARWRTVATELLHPTGSPYLPRVGRLFRVDGKLYMHPPVWQDGSVGACHCRRL